jgi:phosphonate transport system substrate-binding protein
MNHRLSRRLCLGTLGGCTALAAMPRLAQAAERDLSARRVFSLAVVPQFTAVEVNRDWMPLLDRLQRDSGLALQLKMTPSIPRFEAEVLAGLHDFAFMNPYHAVLAARAQGYVPLVRDTKLLTGILVVRKDSPIQTLQALEGASVAFPAPNSFGASLWMRALLAEREKVRITPVYAQTHSNVFRQVMRGSVAAGGAVNKTLQQEHDEVRNDLRVLFETPGAAPHPLCAHPRLPGPVAQALADALLKVGSDPAGQALLQAVQLANPVRADYARDYRPLEGYKLDKYVVL